MSPIPNLLRPLRNDPLVVSVTIWTPGIKTDDEGNEVVDPRAVAEILEGWDIQPIPSTLPPSFSPAGSVEVPNVRRAFIPAAHLAKLSVGESVQNNSTGENYRIGGIQDWKSHGEIYLEVSS